MVYDKKVSQIRLIILLYCVEISFSGGINMKRIINIALATILLTGCGSISEIRTEQEPTHFYQIGVRDCESGAVYDVTSNTMGSTAMFLDYATMKTLPLCAIPNCTHTGSDCLAKVAEHPVVYDGNAYFFTHKEGFEEQKNAKPVYKMHSALKKASLDNSEVEMLCEFEDAVPRSEETMVISGKKLYFIAYDPDVDEDAFAGGSWGNVGGYDYLCSVDLVTGEYRNYGTFCYVEDEYPAADKSASAFITGADSGMIYLSYNFMKEAGDVGSGDVPEWTKLSYEFDIKSEQYHESELPAALCSRDGIYAWADGDKELHIRKGVSETLIDHEVYTSGLDLVNGKLFMFDGWVDTSDMSLHLYKDEESQGLTGLAFFDGCYIMRSGNNTFSKLTEEELEAL